MGGRGPRAADFGPGQSRLLLEEKNRIAQGKADATISQGIGSSAKKGKKQPIIAFKACSCCNEYTIPVGSSYVECPVCKWIDDPYQNEHPESTEGKNSKTLNQAKSQFKATKLSIAH